MVQLARRGALHSRSLPRPPMHHLLAAQGISTKNFFIRCSLRWNYYATFAFELSNPILACVLPALCVVLCAPAMRRAANFAAALKRRIRIWGSATTREIETIRVARERSAKRRAEKNAMPRARRRAEGENRGRRLEMDDRSDRIVLVERIGDALTGINGGIGPDSSAVASGARAAVTDSALARHGSEDGAAQSSLVDAAPPLRNPDTAAHWISSVSERGAGALSSQRRRALRLPGDTLTSFGRDCDHDLTTERVRAERTPPPSRVDPTITARSFDVRGGFFHIACSQAVRLREAPSEASARTDAVVLPGSTVRAEEIVEVLDNAYLRIASSRNSGWLPLYTPERTLIARRVAASHVNMSVEYSAEAAVPVGAGDTPPFDIRTCSEDERDAVAHRFRALEALCPEGGITHDVIGLVATAEATEFEVAAIMVAYDRDRDGRLNLAEYRAADADVRALWRFGSEWSRFADADLDADGTLCPEEVLSLLPSTVSERELPRWVQKCDTAGERGVVTLADMKRLERLVMRDEIVVIAMSSVTMALFFSYIRTAQAIMAMFSTETINGVPYLKKEVGTRAYTPSHIIAICVAVVYGFFFVICVPVAGMYLIYLYRDSFETRRVQAAFGFLFEGYRRRMFFWEFVVLLRKVAILAVALFWEDAFLQSMVGLFVLLVSIVLHMACWPYEALFLNVAELCSLLCLFTLVALALLLWYVQVPGRTQHVLLYELSVTVTLFFMYGALLVVLVLRILFLELRNASKAIVRRFSWSRRLFEAIVAAQRWISFNIHQGDHDNDSDERWTFLRTENTTAREEHVKRVRAIAAALGSTFEETTAERALRIIKRSPGSLLHGASLFAARGSNEGLHGPLSWWVPHGVRVGARVGGTSLLGSEEGIVVAISPDADSRVHVEFVRAHGGATVLKRYSERAWTEGGLAVVATAATATSRRITVVSNPLSHFNVERLRDAATHVSDGSRVAPLVMDASPPSEDSGVAPRTVCTDVNSAMHTPASKPALPPALPPTWMDACDSPHDAAPVSAPLVDPPSRAAKRAPRRTKAVEL